MPGSPTTPSCPRARVDALEHMAFRYTDSVGTRDQFSIAAQWLACTYPYRRFAAPLTDGSARLGADVVRYSFIVGDVHPLLLASLPAHPCENSENSRDLEKSTLQIDPGSTIDTKGGVGRPLKTRFEEVFTQPRPKQDAPPERAARP